MLLHRLHTVSKAPGTLCAVPQVYETNGSIEIGCRKMAMRLVLENNKYLKKRKEKFN